MFRLTISLASIGCFLDRGNAFGLHLQKPKYHQTPLHLQPQLQSTSFQLTGNNEQSVPSNAEVLSQDPLVYVVPNFLSPDECRSYIDRVEYLASHQNRTMTRSNPPKVSIDAKKLWPLPFLSLMAGVPTLLHLDLSSTSFDDLREALLLPISSALGLSIMMAVSAVPILQFVSDSSSRTSDAMALNQMEDVDFVKGLVDRVSSTTKQEWFKWEAPVVTRYSPGAIFAKHGDASPTQGSEWQDLGGQRIVTCICYLNTLEGGGGETAFDRLGVRVRPTQGSALFFFPADANTLEADDRTVHESLEPLEEKWIVQMFCRAGRRVPPPLGLPDAFRSVSSQ
ncbi:procollagen-proline 4-dioxygenase [Fragilaria crotonensis]|nr:procollagen-proline 4-dioxygenase [Fragilaria crotonensis]